MTVRAGCLILLVAASMLLAGCKRDAEVNAALAEMESFTTDMLGRIEAARNPSTGVDEAQQYLDSRKREIKSRAAFLASVRGIQTSDETERKLIETVRRNQMRVISLQSMPLATSDAAFKTKLDKLINDYLSLFQT